ncbi:hypothetical protein V2E24_02545 [Mycoplasmopsis ciconiae]|uniref:Uncharacterized protein n=1 Tax=Mycoplasmopsis ciconiae TaxID=561067 RepID=A0ABU7MLU5_9BACT|nr:hypothetical protein [Mycoplasmopsis ciconiae]
MKIKFRSVANSPLQKEPQVIEFSSDLERSFEEGMDILTFIEPNQNIHNRIEVSKDKVNIFAGLSTINMELNKAVDNYYIQQTPDGKQIKIVLTWLLNKIEHIFETSTKEIYKLGYKLTQNNDFSNIIGDFEITLEIGK